MNARLNSVLNERDRVEQIILCERVHWYNAGRPCGAAAIRRHLIEHDELHPVPSISKIGQVLKAYGLTRGRLGWDDHEEPRWPYGFTKKPKGTMTT